MRFRRSQTSRTLPPHSAIIAIWQVEEGLFYAVPHVSMKWLADARESKPHETAPRGFIASTSKDGYLHIFPSPSKPVEIRVRYTPPAEEC